MSRTTRQAVILTAIWFAGFVTALAIIESYVQLRDENGYRYVLPGERLPLMKPVLITYSAYLAGILGFWFLKPFQAPRTDRATRVRFVLALGCTLLFNLVVAYLLAEGYFVPTGTVTAAGCAERAETWVKYASFLVAPVNAFYFGSKA